MIALHDYPVSGVFPVMAVIEGEEIVESFARSGKYFYPDSKKIRATQEEEGAL